MAARIVIIFVSFFSGQED